MGWLVSLIFGVLAVLGFAAAFVTGSGRALAFGFVDAVVGLVAFCIWAWSL
jgi:C4-dicarboxylate transporter